MSYLIHAEQVEEVRSRFNEPVAATVSNNFITRLLNRGACILSSDIYALDDVITFSSVKNQQEYALPVDFIACSGVIYNYGSTHYKLKEVTKMELNRFMPMYGVPYCYALDRANGKFVVYPTISEDATATTLNGALNATATTIVVTSSTGFLSQGRVIIDSEVIQYTGTTATTLTGCVRGVDGTTAATHLTLAPVTAKNIYLFYSRTPKLLQRLYTTSTVTVTLASTTVTCATAVWTALTVKAGDYFGLGSFSTTSGSETFPVKWYKIASVDSTTQITLTEAYAEASGATQNYIISDPSELQEADCEIPILFAIRELTAKYSNPEKYAHADERLQTEIVKSMNRLNDADYIPQSKMHVEGSGNFSPRLPADVYPQGGY